MCGVLVHWISLHLVSFSPASVWGFVALHTVRSFCLDLGKYVALESIHNSIQLLCRSCKLYDLVSGLSLYTCIITTPFKHFRLNLPLSYHLRQSSRRSLKYSHNQSYSKFT